MAKASSRDPQHRATMARQQAARRKKPAPGKPKATPRTKPGRQTASPSRTRDKVVTVIDWKGNRRRTRESLAKKMLKSEEIPFQEIR